MKSRNPYAHPSGVSISQLQQERLARFQDEPPMVSWDERRAAIIESGLVAERAALRDAEREATFWKHHDVEFNAGGMPIDPQQYNAWLAQQINIGNQSLFQQTAQQKAMQEMLFWQQMSTQPNVTPSPAEPPTNNDHESDGA